MTSTPWLTRPEAAADLSVIRSLTTAAFGSDDEADLVDALRTDPAWIDGLSVVSTSPEGQVVGHALMTRCHIDGVPALALAPCSVLPEFQRRGAGSAAIQAVLGAARDLGEAYVVVLGHAGYYPRFGFTRASPAGIRLTIDVPDEALMSLSLSPDRPLPSGTVRYAAPFGI